MRDLQQEVDFNFIRYANCWEDPEILIQGLNPQIGSRILSIGSAGDNSFSLLLTYPSIIVAVDVNSTQLYLIELKQQAIKYLEYEEVLAFLGFRCCSDRLIIYQKLRSYLSTAAQHYWDSQMPVLEKGIIHQGKFERYFQLFARRILPFIHDRATVEALLAPKDDLLQQQFYNKQWNTWRWRMFFTIFFSRRIMGWLGRDPQFLKEVGVPVGAYILKKAERHLKTVYAQSNPILRYNLTGSFGNMLPHYLREENFHVIRSQIDKLVIRRGYAEHVLDEMADFDCMNLSNIFEYMDKATFRQSAERLIAGLSASGRIAYWNLMVPRRISGIFPSEVTYQRRLSNGLGQKDSGFFYSQFIIDQKNG